MGGKCVKHPVLYDRALGREVNTSVCKLFAHRSAEERSEFHRFAASVARAMFSQSSSSLAAAWKNRLLALSIACCFSHCAPIGTALQPSAIDNDGLHSRDHHARRVVDVETSLLQQVD